MKKWIVFLGLLFAGTVSAQIYDSAILRSYINANLVPNSTRSITATQLNNINGGILNILPPMFAKKLNLSDSTNKYYPYWSNPREFLMATGSYPNPAWITSLALSKITGLTDSLLNKVTRSGTYADPSWITSLAWSKITGTPTTKSGYGITDVMAYADSAAMLANLMRKSDTATELSGYQRRNMALLLSGGSMVGDLILNGDPSTAMGAATRNYVDQAVAGLNWKPQAKAATTANITLSGAQTIDGVSIVAGDTVLVKNQTTTSQNGYYIAAAGSWSRASWGTNGTLILGSAVYVRAGGTTNGGTQWANSNTTVPTVGTDPITFNQVGGPGTYAAGSGLTLTGNVFSISSAAITNAMLANSSLTIGSTIVSLGATAASLAGLTNITATGTVSAGTFSGAGTNLTGTAGSLSIGGTAANATTWNSQAFSNSGSVITPYRFLIYDNSSSAWKPQDIAGTATILAPYAVWVDSTAGNTVVLNAGMALGGRKLAIKGDFSTVGTGTFGGVLTASQSSAVTTAFIRGDWDNGATNNNQLYITGYTNTNKQLRLGYSTANDFGYIQAIINGTGAVPLILNPSGGNVGIGTTTTAAYTNFITLNIGDNSASKIGLLKLKSSYNSGGGAEYYQGTSGDIHFNYNGADDWMSYAPSTHTLAIKTATVTALTINSSQQITVAKDLTVANGIAAFVGPFAASTQYDISIFYGYNQNGYAKWYNQTNNSVAQIVKNASSTTTYTLDGSTGNVISAGSVTATSFFESSDERLKNILSHTACIDGISAIHYTLKKSGQERYGYTAQNVQSVLPFAVTVGDDGFLKVDYTSVFTYKIMLLEQRIAQLEKQSL